MIKNKFVALETPAMKLGRYSHEDEPDTVLKSFKQSENNYKVRRIKPNESITRKNPLSGVQDIKICNSFQMS